MNYYGCEWAEKSKTANPQNLWTTYFTSSKDVHLFIEQYGKPDVIKIHRTFNTAKEARYVETRFLNFYNAAQHPNWLNKHNADENFYTDTHSPETCLKISNSRRGIKFTKQQLKNMSLSHLGYKWPADIITRRENTKRKKRAAGLYNKKRKAQSAEANKKRSETLRALYASGYVDPKKGKTYEEIHGVTKALELKAARSEKYSGNGNPAYKHGNFIGQKQRIKNAA